MGYAFISYCTKNQTAADTIRELFRKNGIATWMAPYDIPAGSKYATVISRALKDCSCLVLMLTNDSQNSTWVSKEVERAISYKKVIIPIQLEDVVLNDEFEFYISTDQIVAVNRIEESSAEIKSILTSVIACTGQDIDTAEKSGGGGDAFRKNTTAPLREEGPTDQWEQYKLGYAYEFGQSAGCAGVELRSRAGSYAQVF